MKILILVFFSFYLFAHSAQASVTLFATGENHACAVLDTGVLKCWGANDKGQLGLGDTVNRGTKSGQMGLSLPAVDLGLATDEKITQIVAAANHTCVLLNTGRVKCFGENSNAELGSGNNQNYGATAAQMGINLPYVNLGDNVLVTKLFAGKNHTCALLQTSGLKCWGYNNSGQLGLEDSKNRGASPTEMGNALPTVNLGTDLKVLQMVGGNQHSCVLFETGKVKCFGRNTEGEEGLQDNRTRGNTASSMGDKLPFLNLGTNQKIVQLAASSFHTCALTDDNKIKCWGYNSSGQLGTENTASYGTASNSMGDGMPTVDLGTPLQVKSINAFNATTCALFENGSAKCWGLNGDGQLGIGNTSDRGDDRMEMGTNLPFVKISASQKINSIFPRSIGTCVLIDQVNELECWGKNNLGQLGMGDDQARGVNIDSLGDNLSFVDLGD